MDRDATLEDFLDAGKRGSSDATTGGSTEERPDDETSDIEKQVAPTLSHRPGGDVCAVCGAVVERRWRDEEGFVCSDCKSW